MKCYKCNKIMKYIKGMKFNEHKLDGWKCNTCGEIYYNPEQAQRVLLLNKLKNKILTLKLNKVRSNKIMRIPKDIDEALGFGNEVKVKIEGKALRVMPS